MRAIIERESTARLKRSTAGQRRSRSQDGEVDAVFVAQAIHWFANDAAIAEIARVAPAGRRCSRSVRNEVDDAAPSPLPEAYRGAHAGAARGRDAARPTDWRDVVARGPFGAITDASVEHEQLSDRAGVLAFALSLSVIAHLPDEERHRVIDDLGAALPEGEYRFAMRTEVSWTMRHTSAPVS